MKCHFIRKEVEYLGHVVTPNGLKPTAKLTAAVLEFPPPFERCINSWAWVHIIAGSSLGLLRLLNPFMSLLGGMSSFPGQISANQRLPH